MKKFLLSAAALMAAMSMDAQVESAFIDADNVFAGIEETKWTDDKGKEQSGFPVEAGHLLCSSDNVTMKIAYQENGKITALAGENDNAKTVTIGGVTYKATKGVTGNQNPTASITEASTNGFVIQFDVKKDGYIYAICKLSSHKPYYVWEGKAGEGEALVAYSLTMHMLDETTPIGAELNYTLPADADGYFDASAADADKYTDGTALRWPEKIVLGAEAEDVKMNGLGIIKFPVYADAETYLLHATGSKVSIDGFVFSPTELEMKVNKVGEEPGDNPEPQPGGDEQTLDIDLTAASWGWGWGVNTSNDGANLVGELTDGWGAVSTGWDPAADWSAYKTLVCVIESAESSLAPGDDGPMFQILAKGNSDDEKAAYYSFNETFTSQKTFEIPLDPKYAGTVKQFWFQGKAAGDKIVISKVYLTTKEATTAINAVKAAAQDSDAIYNIAGQKVNASYKGIVIKDGKKYIQK